MKVLTAVTLAVALVSTPAFAAKEVSGVKFPDAYTADGTELTLKGAGLRKKWFFDVYAIGLYVADPSKPVLSDQAKMVRMVLLRDLSKDQIGEALREGFERNSAAQMPKLKDRLDKLISVLTNGKKGDSLLLTYVPGKGTVVTGKGKQLTVIEGQDFAQALFSVWIGANPVDSGLKDQMLGK